ncbi:Disease resistance protein RPM1 [Forsythia ovata]|uniref:Disease resistance protein RPM1 n=1 Tax=Forsythia ovata TaxID=205694 RepID=A0ABD1RN36_9LAMI
MYHMYSMKQAGFFHRAVFLPKDLWMRHKTIVQLKKIKHEIEEISKRSKRYDLSHIEEYSAGLHHALNYAQNIGETSFFVEGSEVVGIDEESIRLLKFLTEGENQRTVISIVGMAGSGKTTLDAHANNNHGVKKCFDCYAWVSVSQNYMIEGLLRKMINEFFNGREKFVSPSLSTTNYKLLVETLVNFLQGKKYMIVLDDVWTSSLWRQVSVALPDNGNGSRVIITTQKEDIASYPYAVGSHVLHSQPLSKSNAWNLFCKKAFCNEPGRSCPPDLEDIARTMVEKCDGLPLAILALGGLMASKDTSEIKWKEVHDSFSWHISNNSLLDEVKTILLLSFKDLPYYLKNCILYCCRFPIEHWAGAGRLIRMCMAEGFLEERKGLSPEDVGKFYLKELISRNLLQVEKHSTFLRPKLCKLQDLMWELASTFCVREGVLLIYI